MSYALYKSLHQEEDGTALRIVNRAPKATSKLSVWDKTKCKPYSGKSTNPWLEHLPKLTSALIGSIYWGNYQHVQEWTMPTHWHLAKVPGEPFKIKVSVGLALGDEPFKRYERILDIKRAGGIANASLYICPTCTLGSRYLFISLHKPNLPLECWSCTSCNRTYEAMTCGAQKSPMRSDRPFKRYWHMANKYLEGRMPDGELPAPAYCAQSVELTPLMRNTYKTRALARIKPALDALFAPFGSDDAAQAMLTPKKKRVRRKRSQSSEAAGSPKQGSKTGLPTK